MEWKVIAYASFSTFYLLTMCNLIGVLKVLNWSLKLIFFKVLFIKKKVNESLNERLTADMIGSVRKSLCIFKACGNCLLQCCYRVIHLLIHIQSLTLLCTMTTLHQDGLDPYLHQLKDKTEDGSLISTF